MIELRDQSSTESKLKRIKREDERVLGSLASIYSYRTNYYVDSLIPNLFYFVWDMPILMFLGMAFLKLGILSGNAATRTYLMMAVLGLGIGLVLSYFRLQPFVEAKGSLFDATRNINVVYFNLDRVIRTIGILGLIMLLYKSGVFKWLFSLMKPVGQMALTNYLGQSVICGFIFNGYGLGWFDQLQRYEIYLVVFGVWIFQTIFSNIWMRYFLFGPCEWAWRSATYWKRQPILKGQ
jgi:uncharacterized protein